MDAVGAAGERDVKPVVDDDARGGAAREAEQVGGERGEVGRREVAFAQVDEIDARIDGVLRLFEHTTPSRLERGSAGQEPAPIGDEAQHHEWPL